MKISYCAVSDMGNVRSNNEDNFRIKGFYRTDFNEKKYEYSGESEQTEFVAAVFDGMGGEDAGEVASLIAAENLQTENIEDVHTVAEKNINIINDKICSFMDANGGRSGSTLAVLYINDSTAMSCNLGDSEVYLFRKGVLNRISKIHNKAQMLVDMGMITAEEAHSNKGKYVLTQYLGIKKEEMTLSPAFSEEIKLELGDRFLICSDGLSDAFSEKELCNILEDCSSVDSVTTARRLLTGALETECKDNTTAIVVDIR